MKIISAIKLGIEDVFDLSVDHDDHSFQLAAGPVAHNCGIVLADRPVQEYCPTININGVKVTGFSPKSVELAGLVKLDILGLNTLRDIQVALESIKERLGDAINPWDLPYDKKCFEQFAAGNTETVFQFDTNVVRPYLTKTRPKSLDDLAAITALCRPGTLEAPYGDGRTLAEVYVARKQGEPTYHIHPDMAPITGDTMGIQLYQEQTMRIFRDIGGFSNEDAEAVRRGIGKKDEKVLSIATGTLRKACSEKGWTGDQVNLLMDQIMASARYSFNKSHAVSYAYVAYACMYLKTNYKLDWWKAALSNSTKDEVAAKFWRHVQDFTSLPDINQSTANYTIVGEKIVSPISIMNGVGEKAYKQLVENAPYRDLEHFVAVHLNKRTVATKSPVTTGTAKMLIAGGVLDSLFDKTYTVEEKLEIFEALKAKVRGEYPKPIAKEYSEFIGITELGRYMVKKQLISIYSKDLRPLLLPNRGGTVRLDKAGNIMAYWMKTGEDDEGNETGLHVLDGNQIDWAKQRVEKVPLSGNDTRYWAAIAYVVEEKPFQYQAKTKQATKLVIDVNGYFTEEMLWPAMGKTEAEAGFKGLPCLVVYKEYKNKFVVDRLQRLLDEKDLERYNMV